MHLGSFIIFRAMKFPYKFLTICFTIFNEHRAIFFFCIACSTSRPVQQFKSHQKHHSLISTSLILFIYLFPIKPNNLQLFRSDFIVSYFYYHPVPRSDVYLLQQFCTFRSSRFAKILLSRSRAEHNVQLHIRNCSDHHTGQTTTAYRTFLREFRKFVKTILIHQTVCPDTCQDVSNVSSSKEAT